MLSALFRWMTPEDWKKAIALVILWAYAYQLVGWPLLFWITTLVSAHWVAIPAPPVVPWEQLFAGTTTLATVGGIERWREAIAAKGSDSNA